MRKFANDIELAIYTMLIDSALKTTIKGGIYRNGIRPHDSKNEDIVIAYLAGLDGQFQESVVNVNIYVPDLNFNGMFVKDISRLTTLERAFGDWFYKIVPTNYLLSLDNIPVVIQEEEFNQHYINIRINVLYNTLN